jgi:cellulose synthase/poly-beta-1,6-N-acetylglucosamine synthase-like glycosyltransferase
MELEGASIAILTYVTVSTIVFAFSDAILSYLLIRISRQKTKIVEISDIESYEIPDSILPIITVLVPLYKEEITLTYLLETIAKSNYPKDKLDIRLLVEPDDYDTLRAITSLPRRANQTDGILYNQYGFPIGVKGRHGVEAKIDYVYMHHNGVRTKPNALNKGLINARGKIITVYDADDRPDTMQLRKVAVYMLKHPEVACVQARLKYYNSDQSIITKLFSIEYIQHFLLILPLFYSINKIILLGGSSNFIRTEVLRGEMKGWDPQNVTEDADLAIRLAKKGFKIIPLNTVTWEEAPPKIYAWFKQRIRWNKGFLYTLGVHFNNPSSVTRSIGSRSSIFLFFALFAPAIFAISVPGWIIFLVFWIDWSGIITIDPLSEWIQEAYFYAPSIFYISLFTLVFSILYHVIVAFEALFLEDDEYALQKTVYILLIPFHTILQNMAAIISIIELFLKPRLWHKTPHGLFIEKR